MKSINLLLNDFLYDMPDKDDKKFDINIFNSINDVYNNDSTLNFYEFLLNKKDSCKKSITFNFDLDSDESYSDFFNEKNRLNFYGGSLSKTKYGLQKSQLKSLTALFESLSNNDMIAINGAPGTGKSTILNYVISNILINSLLEQHKTHKISFKEFLWKHFKMPKIFLTGKSRVAVQNISDISKIKFPEEHKWIYTADKNKEEYINNIFNSWDIHLSDDSTNNQEEQTTNNNNNNQNSKKISRLTDKYSFKELNNIEIKDNFHKKSIDYFKEEVSWYQIPDKLYKKLLENIQEIEDINDVIRKSFDTQNKHEIFKYIKTISIMNKIENVFKLLLKWKEQKFKSEVIELNVLEAYDDLLKLVNITSDKSVSSIFKKTNKFLAKYNKIIKKPKKTNKWLLKSILEFNEWINITNSYIRAKNFFERINNSLKTIRKIFNNDELRELGLEKDIPITQNINDETFANIIMILDIIKINFNNIQEKLDINYRTENSFLFRHICEWLFIDNWSKNYINQNSELKSLSPIKPIVSSNLQNFNLEKLKKHIIDDLNLTLDCFDYLILDEASQAPTAYIPFILMFFKKIIVVGDEKQLPPINDRLQLKKHFNKFNQDKKIAISHALSKLNILDATTSKPILNSVLDWVNEFSNVSSMLKNNSTNEVIKKPGLYLLEHMRCPPQMYKVFNNCFYDNSLTYNKPVSYNYCSYSKYAKLLCNQSTNIQLTYSYKKQKDNNSNIQEIEIATNFIFDNIKHFIAHEYKDNVVINEETINYLINNLYFISFYNDQNDSFKKTICKINEYLKEPNLLNEVDFLSLIEESKISYYVAKKILKKYTISEIRWIIKLIEEFKYGTVDATQGIGSDFILFSNVSENVCHKSKKFLIGFENNDNRVNVLFSRCKQHFIEITSNQYMDNNDKINQTKLVDAQNGFKARQQTSETINNDFNRIVFDIDFKKLDNNLSIENLWNSNKYKDNIKDKFSKINHIGKYGETIFKTLTEDKVYSRLLSKKAKEQLGLKINFFKNVNWENADKESSKEFDFSINNDQYFIDIKSSINNGKTVFLSEREENFAKEHKDNYFIGKINDISKFNLNIRNQSSIFFILNKISFYKLNNDDKFMNEKNMSIEYELR